MMRPFVALCVVVIAACAGPASGPPDAHLANGCPVLDTLQAQPGDPIPDTWTNFAMPFFAQWCTRCHSTANVGAARNGAPDGYNWDDATSVRAHLDLIRRAVGVTNFMPFNPPDPTCDQRQQLVRWIDAAAPGLP